MALKLQNKTTGEVIDPRVDDFALSPADLGDFDNWDDALSQDSEIDIVEGFAVIDGDDEPLSPIAMRIDERLTLDNIRKLMDHIESAVGDMEEETYMDIVEAIRVWVCNTFAQDQEQK